MATISLHTKHSGHQPGTDTDKLLLPVHPIVVSLAMENLKRMVSTSTVALASKNEERKIMSMVGGLERVTFRFYLIFNEVARYDSLSIFLCFVNYFMVWFSFLFKC